jgi:hypothetical protein
MSVKQSEELTRRALFGAGTGVVAGATLAAAQASGLMTENEVGASGNFVAAEVVASNRGVLHVERVDNRERLVVVINGKTRMPDPTLATASAGRIVGINAEGIAHARANAKVEATVVAPCVLGLLSEAERRQDVPR